MSMQANRKRMIAVMYSFYDMRIIYTYIFIHKYMYTHRQSILLSRRRDGKHLKKTGLPAGVEYTRSTRHPPGAWSTLEGPVPGTWYQ